MHLTGDDNVQTVRKGFLGKAVPSLATHDDRATRSFTLEEREVLGDMPWDGVVAAYRALAVPCGNQCQHCHQTATGALIEGCGSYPSKMKSS